MELRGTKTEQNVKDAFKGESMAAMRYFLYQEQLEDISQEYEEELDFLMKNESEHAEVFLEMLGMMNLDNEALLKYLISFEGFEASFDYPEMAKVADAEGFPEVAKKFMMVANIEKTHKEKLEHMLNKIQSGQTHKTPVKVVWECMHCGHTHEGTEAPMVCPFCGHSREHFRIKK